MSGKYIYEIGDEVGSYDEDKDCITSEIGKIVAWAIVAYLVLLPIFRHKDKTEMVIRL